MSRAWLLGGVVTLCTLIAVLASVGQAFPPPAAVGAALEWVATGGLAAGLYLASAFGWGLLGDRLWRGSPERSVYRVGVGLAVLLTLAHGLFGLGLLNVWIGLGLLVPGWVLAGWALWRASRREGERLAAPGKAALFWLPAAAVLIVASCSPPGVLWESEFGGYDALSYHLQLPQEWLASGRLAPLEHNVYSYLPGYLEAAFAHLGVATFASMENPSAPVATGLLAGSGWRLAACQFLNAWIAVLGAWCVRRSVLAACRSGGTLSSRQNAAAWLAGGFVLATPWLVVTGSMAYNDVGVVLFGAAALTACVDRGLKPLVRSGLAGVLVGAACGVKPTAMLFVAPVAGVLLLGCERWSWRTYAGVVLVGGAVGAAMLAPWLIRNAAYGGNPVFPHLTELFGTAHWTQAQVARYASGHTPDVAWPARLGMLVWPWGDTARGFGHTQWGIFGPVLLGCVGVALASRRRLEVLLVIGIGLQLAAWLGATHLQSRFLLPVVVSGGMLGGLILARTSARGSSEVWMRFAAAVVLVQSAVTIWNFLRQNDWQPNERLVTGPSDFSGEAYREALGQLSPRERALALANMADSRFVNLGLPPEARLLLIGDATPLYFRQPLRYATTWDTSVLASVMRSDPDDPASWTRALQAEGIDYVLINFAELARLGDAGWLDPVLTPDRVAAWATTAGEVVWRWPLEAPVPMKVILRLEPSLGR